MITFNYIKEYDESEEGEMVAEILVDDKVAIVVEHTDHMGGFDEIRDINKSILFLFLKEFNSKYANNLDFMIDSEENEGLTTFNFDTEPVAIINNTEITFLDEEGLAYMLAMVVVLVPAFEETLQAKK